MPVEIFEIREKKCLYLPYIDLYTNNLWHHYKAGDQASSVELLDDLRVILSRCKDSQTADFLFYQLIWTKTIIIISSSHTLWMFFFNILYELMFLIFEGMSFHIMASLKIIAGIFAIICFSYVCSLLIAYCKNVHFY